MKKLALFIISAILLSLSTSAQMILVFDTNLSVGTTVRLQFNGTVDVTVDWGDGNIESFNTSGLKDHTYSSDGEYTVRIYGTLTNYGLGNDTYADKLIQVTSFGNIGLTSLSWAFLSATNLTEVPDILPATVTDLSYMFSGATSFNQDISSWDVSNVTNMRGMFSRAPSFNQNIENWDVSNVTDMNRMFIDATNFNQPIGAWDISNVTDLGAMFDRATSFDQKIETWDVGKVTDMSYMFYQAPAFNQPLANWNVSQVTNMSYMFYEAAAFNQPLENWNVSQVTNMSYMFYKASAFNQNIGNWDVSKVIAMSRMFMEATAFNQDIGNWNVSNVINMTQMFAEATAFNQDISNWNVSNVTTMAVIFGNATSFNQDISSWNVSNVSNMYRMFDGVTLSTNNYDALLIGWSSQTLQPNVDFHGGNSKYSCELGAAARNILTGAPNNWTITDGGVDLLPIISTTPPVINCSLGTSGGTVDLNCGDPITERGIVWHTSPNPTTLLNSGITTDGSGEGTFISDISGLSENTTYYLRAYATSSNGTQYGQEEIFTIGEDNIVPELPVLTNVSDECSVTLEAPTTNDACTGVITGTTDDPLTYTEQGIYIVTWTFDDGNGNSVTADQTVTIDDVSAPVPDIATLSDVTGECSVTVSTAPTATDNCAGQITGITTDPLTYSIQGIYTITWTYDDGNGNTSTQTQTIIIDDSNAPVPDITDLSDITGECSVTVSTTPTATDNCAGSTTGTTTDPLTYTEQGTYTITWTYDDGNENTSSQTQTVIVDDVTAPIPDITNLSDVTDECSVTLTAPTATDNCEGSITGTTTSTFPITAQGTTVVTWTYNDGNGNTSLQTQTVIVEDITVPVPDITNLNGVTGECSVAVSTAPTANDNCVGSITGTTTDPLTYSDQGSYTITWTYDDGNGNTSSQTQTVIVDDNTAPVSDITELSDLTGECSVTVTITPTATDNCAGSITGTTTDPLTYTEQGIYIITWNFDDGNGNTSSQTQTIIVDDTTAPIADITELGDLTGECSVTVSTEPTATDNCMGSITGTTTDPLTYTEKGTYTITWTFDDGNGNTSSQTQTVIINDIAAPVADITNLSDLTGECSVTVSTEPTATDNCAGPITGTTNDPLTYSEQGTYTITWNYDDGNGNTSSQTQTVIVDDNTPPVPDITNLSDVTGECSVTVSAIPTATDICAGPITGTTNGPFTYTEQGTYTITWNFDDGNGNTSSQTQTVIVDDNTLPVPDITNLSEVTGECSVTVSTEPTATDNCAGPITGTTTDPLTYTEQGTYTITWNFDDGNGNTSTQDQTVVINAGTEIITQPVTYTNICETESDITLNISAIGAGSLNYQWYLNGSQIIGETGSSLTVIASANNSGIYTCEVIDICNSITSNDATVVISDFATANAGSDDVIYDIDDYQLSGNNPSSGTGIWTSDQTSITYNDQNLFNANANLIPEGLTTFTWTITNGACSDNDDVEIRRFISANTITLSTEDLAANPEETDIPLKLMLDNQTGLSASAYSLDVKIYYDATQGIHASGNYNLTGRTTGFTAIVTVNEAGADSYVHIFLEDVSGTNYIAPGTGSILDILFYVDNSVVTPSVSTISMNDVICKDEFNQNFMVDFYSLSNFYINQAGDLNGDGVLDFDDLQTIILVLLGIIDDPETISGSDLNNDGVINAQDIVLLLQLLNGKGLHITETKGNNEIIIPNVLIDQGTSDIFRIQTNNENPIAVFHAEFSYNSLIGFDIYDLSIDEGYPEFDISYIIDDSNPAEVLVKFVVYSESLEEIQSGINDILKIHCQANGNAEGQSDMLLSESTVSDINAELLNTILTSGSVTINSSTVNIVKNMNLNIYPNPTEDFITIENLGSLRTPVEIKITDSDGKVIYYKIHTDKIVELDLGKYSKGIYFIRLSQEDKFILKKIVKI